MQLIPLQPGVPRQALETSVNGQRIRIEVAWQPRTSHWHATVTVLPGTILCQGRQVIVGESLLPDGILPFDGDILCEALIPSPDSERLNLNSWGTTHDLIYLTGKEAEAL